MAIYSTNQVRHLYVAKSLANAKVTQESPAATIRPVADDAKTHLYFEVKGATDLMRSDLIPIENIMYAKATKASDLCRNLMGTTVTLDPNINDGEPIPGQDYILNINIRQYIGMSDRNQTVKYGAVRAFKGMTKSKFYAQMAKSLALNFSRELAPMLKFYVATSPASLIEVTPSTDVNKLTGNYTGIVIREVPQEWELGIKSQEPVYYEVYSTTVKVYGEDTIWANVVNAPYGKLENGKEIADLEYFCMGDRGDYYRNIGWPNVINTKYLVDPEVPYDVIDLHYYYVGNNENPQKSEKDITIVVPNATGNSALTNQIIAAINAASGLQIATLSNATTTSIADPECEETI